MLGIHICFKKVTFFIDFTGNYWCIQQKLYDKLLGLQKHFPHMGPRSLSQQGVAIMKQLTDINTYVRTEEKSKYSFC